MLKQGVGVSRAQGFFHSMMLQHFNQICQKIGCMWFTLRQELSKHYPLFLSYKENSINLLLALTSTLKARLCSGCSFLPLEHIGSSLDGNQKNFRWPESTASLNSRSGHSSFSLADKKKAVQTIISYYLTEDLIIAGCLKMRQR